MNVLNIFRGYSNSEIFLIKEEIFKVRKIGNIQRNLDQYNVLRELKLNIPEIYNINLQKDYYDMEYIHGLDMKSYLVSNYTTDLINFILEVISKLRKNQKEKFYKDIYEEKLNPIDFNLLGLSFTKDQLIKKLPSYIPSSNYHGDFTLDNILYDTNKKRFVLIDPLQSVYDSYVFDLIKLRQDLDCKWFLRKSNSNIDDRLDIIKKELRKIEFFSDDYLLILMLLRIINYTNNPEDKLFLIEEIEKLWK